MVRYSYYSPLVIVPVPYNDIWYLTHKGTVPVSYRYRYLFNSVLFRLESVQILFVDLKFWNHDTSTGILLVWN
jgi:hypothetical protein